MVVNIILIIAICILVSIVIIRYLNTSSGRVNIAYDYEEDLYNIDNITQTIKESFNNILKTNLHEMNLSKEEFDKRMRNKNQLRKALKNCTYGDLNSKNYVKDFIKDILLKSYDIDEFNINNILNFNNPKELSTQDKFEILLFHYKKKYEYQAFEKLIVDNKLDEPKAVNEDEETFIITKEDIERVYKQEVGKLNNFQDKLNIIIQRIYQTYKGYGVIDEIRDMKIDGISGGVSGIPSTFFQEVDYNNKILTELPSAYDSIWIFFKGKTIHLSFLSFGSEKELIRVCKNIYRYNNPGQLSESNGYKVNEMKDGSRVVVARPPFCESWVFFVRKFDSVVNRKLEDLIVDNNSKLAIDTIKWLIKGCRVTSITGQQGTGKTTLMMSIVKFINPSYTLRIQEMAFELHLRKLYPFRNIVTFRETGSISGQEGLDLQKKTDGTVNILGEVATAPVASWMIQMAQVASLFTMFTHHAKTAENLVIALRNSLLQTGVFNNEKIAEKQVADVVNFDVHLSKNINGHRYIERITEIVPISQNIEYPSKYLDAESHEEKLDYFLDTMKEFFQRMTDRKTFETRDIIRWENGEYIVANPISIASIKSMINHLSTEDKIHFNEFINSNWSEVV